MEAAVKRLFPDRYQTVNSSRRCVMVYTIHTVYRLYVCDWTNFGPDKKSLRPHSCARVDIGCTAVASLLIIKGRWTHLNVKLHVMWGIIKLCNQAFGY